MRNKISKLAWVTIFIITACSAVPVPAAVPGTAAVLRTAAPTALAFSACPDLLKIANAFYTANDANQLVPSLSYLTEDVIMVFWAEGINGHHMGQKVVIGKDQMKAELNGPGFHLKTGDPDKPVFRIDHSVQVGNELTFNLTPDRTHPDGRPYDPYVIELIFSGCRIDIFKITERITWV